MTIVVRKTQFQGNAKVFSRENDGLAAIIRGLAIDNAIAKIIAASPQALTDSTGGTAGTMPYAIGSTSVAVAAAGNAYDVANWPHTPPGQAAPPSNYAALVAPSGVFDAHSAGGVLTSALITSVAKTKNAFQGWVALLNNVRARLGMKPVTYTEGSLGSYGTIVAQDLSNTTGASTLAVNYGSYLATAGAILNNQAILLRAMNEVLAALGEPQIINTFNGSDFGPDANKASMGYQLGDYPYAPGGANQSFVLGAIPAPVDDTTTYYPGATIHAEYLAGTVAADYVAGTTSVKLADGSAFMQQVANNFATLGVAYTNFVVGLDAQIAALTTGPGGTDETPDVLVVAATAPVGFQSALTTDSLPTAGGNTQVTLWKNALSSFLAKINLYRAEYGLPALVDNIGGTVSSVVAAEAATTTGVSGGVQAAGTLTEATTTNFINGDTMTIGNQVINFVTALNTGPAIANQIQVRANTAAGFALTCADITAFLLAGGQGIAGTIAQTGTGGTGFTPSATVSNVTGAVLVANSGGGATYLFTAIADGVGGNAYTFTNTSSHSEVMDGSGTLGGTTTGAAPLGASLASWNATIAGVANNLAYITAQLNALGTAGGSADLEPLIDQTGGVNMSATVAVPMLATADNAPVAKGGLGAVGVQNSVSNTIVAAIRNDMTTLYTQINRLVNAATWGVGLHVVAGRN